jgi:hypothetical protein
MDSIDNYRLEEFFGKKKIKEIPKKYNDEQLLRVLQACTILKSLGLDKRHYFSTRDTDPSAWVLMALAGVSKNVTWNNAENEAIGIDFIINFISENFGFQYKPNSREGIRKKSLHEFLYYRIINQNEDEPDRATNSSAYNYSLTPEFLKVLKSYKNNSWEHELDEFISSIDNLRKEWKRKVDASKISIFFNENTSILLSPGEHNRLQADIIEKFCPEFLSESYSVIYVGDADKIRNSGGKLLHIDANVFSDLDIEMLDKGKLPDVMVYDSTKNWLFLIEAVTSSGEISAKRHDQLASMFSKCKASIVYVTAFPTKTLFRRFVVDIAWETEVWIADNPDHMIHFNGDKFLGPHES